MSYGPGIYEDITNKDYHADAALGSTGLKGLVTMPPAKWKWQRDNPKTEAKAQFDIGTVVHSLVLEQDESGIVELKAENRLTKVIREEDAQARAAGRTPLLTKELAMCHAMRDAIMATPEGRAAFNGHRAEVSVFVDDDGLMVKCRPDAWQDYVLIDLKNLVSANPADFPKAAYDFGYYQSAAHYVDVVKAATGEELPFVFFLAEKEPPYLVSVVELDADALHYGRRMNDRAKQIYRNCTETGHWPGYPETTLISLPQWATYKLEGILQ